MRRTYSLIICVVISLAAALLIPSHVRAVRTLTLVGTNCLPDPIFGGLALICDYADATCRGLTLLTTRPSDWSCTRNVAGRDCMQSPPDATGLHNEHLPLR